MTSIVSFQLFHKKECVCFSHFLRLFSKKYFQRNILKNHLFSIINSKATPLFQKKNIDSIHWSSCSCFICHQFDDNKDPSSCGISCHIECALQHQKVGVNSCQLQLDGSYCCASCGKVSSIIGFWKQLKIAKEAHRVDVLCYRIFLNLKAELEIKLGPLNEAAAKMSRGHAGRLHAASHGAQSVSAVQILKNAMDLVMFILKLYGKRLPTSSTEFDLNTTPVPDLNEELNKSDTTNRSHFIDNNVSGGLDDNFEYIVKTICGLEHGGHVSKEFRLKFLRWFSLRSREHERRVVRTFVKTLIDDPSSLAGQLVDTFSDIIFSSRP
ncbi:hypothetical protein Pfo_008095 [Paulownia fortunei]|nr:hypothetical protein Pfo_008095 [Paulownia fortunei]